MERKKKDDL